MNDAGKQEEGQAIRLSERERKMILKVHEDVRPGIAS